MNIFLLTICFFLLLVIDPLSILSMVSFLFLGLLGSRIFFKENVYSKYALIFCVYTIFAIVLFLSNLEVFPLNSGCTGSEISGTDDLFFFQEATNGGVSYRGDRSKYMHHYSMMLENIHTIASIFKKTTLIDLIFVNIFFLAYIPIFCSKVAFFFTDNTKAGKLAFRLALFSPFLIQQSLVLVRDGITAAMFIGIFYFYLRRKYFLMLCFLSLLVYLRLLSGGLAIFFVLGYIYFTEKKSRVLKYGLFFAVIIYLFLPEVISNLDKSGVISEGIFRQSYFEYIRDGAKSGSGAVTILSLPAYLRIPLGTLYFIGTPFLNVRDILSLNVIYLWPKLSFFYSIAFVFYIIYLVRAVFVSKKHILKFLVFEFVIISGLFSQISLELRHKTLIMPILFVIVAISYYTKPAQIVRQFSLLVASVVVVLQVGFNLVTLFI